MVLNKTQHVQKKCSNRKGTSKLYLSLLSADARITGIEHEVITKIYSKYYIWTPDVIRGVTPFWRASKTTNQPIQAGKPPRCRDSLSTNQPGAARPCRDAVSTNQPDMLDPAGMLQKLRFNQPVFNQPFVSPRSLSFPVTATSGY